MTKETDFSDRLESMGHQTTVINNMSGHGNNTLVVVYGDSELYLQSLRENWDFEVYQARVTKDNEIELTIGVN